MYMADLDDVKAFIADAAKQGDKNIQANAEIVCKILDAYKAHKG